MLVLVIRCGEEVIDLYNCCDHDGSYAILWSANRRQVIATWHSLTGRVVAWPA